jgi:IMP dehydrogenase
VRLGLSFDDVLLEPKYSEITSRSMINIGNRLGDNLNFSIPIITAPMDTITESEMAVCVGSAGALGIIHRYNSIEEQVSLVKDSTSHLIKVGAAIGTRGDYLERAVELVDNGVSVLCLDVAHGHHILVRNALTELRKHLSSRVHIMAGNVATKQAFYDLSDWGANSIRVGIGGGSICSTRIQTGHGIPTLQSVLECADAARDMNVRLIADGGIKNSGDMVKALAAGADFVMAGSLFAGTTNTPGEIIKTRDGDYKAYRGMASKEAQRAWKGSVSSREGISTHVPYKGSTEAALEELVVGIRSGFSYSGAKNIFELQTRSTFLQQTGAGTKESNTHILTRK